MLQLWLSEKCVEYNLDIVFITLQVCNHEEREQAEYVKTILNVSSLPC